MNNYFDFITYLAFETILSYENKRSLSLDELGRYRLKLCELHSKNHFINLDDEEFKIALNNFYMLNYNMTIEDEYNNIIKFLKKNNKLFEYKDGYISLRKGVTLDRLEVEKFNLPCYEGEFSELICSELIRFHDSIECLNELRVEKILEHAIEVVEDSKKLEQLYLDNFSNEVQDKIKKESMLFDFKMSLIGNLNDDKLSCYDRVFEKFEDAELGEDDLWLISEETFTADEFYLNVSNEIDYYLTDKYQRAIFDNKTLAYDKIDDTMSLIWNYRTNNIPLSNQIDFDSFEDEEEDEELDNFYDEFDLEEDFDDEIDDIDVRNMTRYEAYLFEKRINKIFYFNYIKNLDNYQKIYGKNTDLEMAKNRLLYLFDDAETMLYKEENFNRELNNLSTKDLYFRIDFDVFYVISRLFLVDLLEGYVDDELTLRKMLFVSTYYGLTKDKRIERIFAKYRNNPNMKKIFNNNFSKKDNPKKLIKRKEEEEEKNK